MSPGVDVPNDRIEAICRKWRIREFSLFGSVARGDADPGSDVDVLLRFDPSFHKTLFDLVDLREELKAVFGREVDLVQEEDLQNPYRRRAILRSRKRIYAA